MATVADQTADNNSLWSILGKFQHWIEWQLEQIRLPTTAVYGWSWENFNIELKGNWSGLDFQQWQSMVDSEKISTLNWMATGADRTADNCSLWSLLGKFQHWIEWQLEQIGLLTMAVYGRSWENFNIELNGNWSRLDCQQQHSKVDPGKISTLNWMGTGADQTANNGSLWSILGKFQHWIEWQLEWIGLLTMAVYGWSWENVNIELNGNCSRSDCWQQQSMVNPGKISTLNWMATGADQTANNCSLWLILGKFQHWIERQLEWIGLPTMAVYGRFWENFNIELNGNWSR